MRTKPWKHAFTLIEMLVVVGILAILATILMPSFSAMVERGHATRCASNLKQLYFSTMNYLAASGNQLPYSASWQSQDFSTRLWSEQRGWVAWQRYPTNYIGSLPAANGSGAPAADLNNYWTSGFSYTNIIKGTLFQHTGLTQTEMQKGRSIYFCPTAARRQNSGANIPVRTYMMNRSLSGGNMYAQNAAADVMLFGEANFTAATTIVTSDFLGNNAITTTNTQKRMHSNRSFNAVFLDGHVGRGF